MRRRDFVKGIVGSAVSWPLSSRAQQPEQMRRIGVLMNVAAPDPEGQPAIALFQQSLQKLGWTVGSNVGIDIRWGENDPDRDRKFAAELVASAPDVILAAGTLSVTALQRVTRAVPIVFVISDPIGAGVVDTLARPGSNVTGFMNFEYSLSGKWVELLKQITPRLTRAAVLRDGANPAGIAQFGAIRTTASSLGVDVSPIDIRDANEIERAVASFARTTNGGLIVTPSAGVSVHHALIVALAATYKLPAVYADGFNVRGGGLISYGPSGIDQFRRAADYVDRVLRGEKPGDLPVQAPTKFDLLINLKTAKAIGLTIPSGVLATADEVIE